MYDLKSYEYAIKRIKARQTLEQAVVSFLIVEGRTDNARDINKEFESILEKHESRINDLLKKENAEDKV